MHLDRLETRDNKEIRERKAPLGQLERPDRRARRGRPEPLAFLVPREVLDPPELLGRLDLPERLEIQVRLECLEGLEERVLLGLWALPVLLVYQVVLD